MDRSGRSGEMEGELSQLISFSVGDEEYGLEILRVKEVIHPTIITRLPRAPSFVKGIINLRGDVIPIVDLRSRFGLDEIEYRGETRVIVVDMEGRLVGMIVDRATQVLRIPAAQIDPPPPMVGRLPAEFIKGIGKLDGRLVILLDVDRILSSEEVVGLGALSEGAETIGSGASEPANAGGGGPACGTGI